MAHPIFAGSCMESGPCYYEWLLGQRSVTPGMTVHTALTRRKRLAPLNYVRALLASHDYTTEQIDAFMSKRLYELTEQL